MPEARGHDVIITCFADTNHVGNLKERKSQTGVLIFLNRASIYWYSEQQPAVEMSIYGAELLEEIRYKLRIFEVPIDGPANVCCDNEAVSYP